MKFFLIDDGTFSGEHNMSFDIQLAENCKDDELFFRLYQWKPYAISLGANQSFSDVDLEKVKDEQIHVVKRPTGGRAIFHSEEITYSFICPLSYGLSPKEIYQSVSEALVYGLLRYDKRLDETSLEQQQPNFTQILQNKSGGICFASTAKNEVKYTGKKLIGSAQKKMKNVVLQHGSILCGTKHKELVNFLNFPIETKLELKKEINDKTIEIESILNEKVDYKRLRNCLTLGFEEYFGIEFNRTLVPELK